MSKKDKIDSKSGDRKIKKTVAEKPSEETKTVSKKINDGKCCRCVSRNCKLKICGNKKSPKYGKYVARKGGCNCFKYND